MYSYMVSSDRQCLWRGGGGLNRGGQVLLCIYKHKRDRVAEENASAAVSFKSDLSPGPAEQWPRDQGFQRSAKGLCGGPFDK